MLEIWERGLGPEHHDTVLAKGDLAKTLHERGELAEAEQLTREVLEIWERTLGPEHHDTVLAKENLANTLHNRGQLAEAELAPAERIPSCEFVVPTRKSTRSSNGARRSGPGLRRR